MKITIKPAPDRRVRHEDGRLLDDAGESVDRSTYWIRRLDDADVIEVAPVDDKPRRKGADA